MNKSMKIAIEEIEHNAESKIMDKIRAIIEKEYGKDSVTAKRILGEIGYRRDSNEQSEM